jgi:hypothetical protein
MDPLIEAYLGIYEAKVDAGSPLEKEDIRNKREFGAESGRNKKTGLRRFFHGVSRGVKKDTPTGNEPSEISGRFGTGAEVRREIRKLKARKQGRDIAKQSKIDREAREYVKKANSQFAADSAENKIVKFNREELEYILDILVSEGFAVDYEGAECILEAMSDEWVDCILDEGNREEREWEKKGMSSKDQAMAKARVRRHRFDAGTTHTNVGRENITWARPGTSGYSTSIDRQRKDAHRMARKRKKARPGTSPEDRRWADFAGDKKEGKYEKLQKSPSKSAQVSAQKSGLVRQGERRRGLRTQAVNALRRTLGGGVVDN